MAERFWMLSTVLAVLLMAAVNVTTFAAMTMVGRIHLKRKGGGGQALITEDGPEIGEAMPEIAGRDLQGRAVRLTQSPGREAVVLLTSQTCSSCRTLLHSVRATVKDWSMPIDVYVVLEATPENAGKLIRLFRIPVPVIVDETNAIGRGLGVARAPYGFLVDDQGVVRMKGVVTNRDQLEGLFARRGRGGGGLMWEHSDQAAEPISVG